MGEEPKVSALMDDVMLYVHFTDPDLHQKINAF